MPASHLEPPVGEGPIERACKWASEAALITMLVVIGADIFTRYLLNFSFEIADELGGYMLVVMTFVSLSVCQVNGAFHQVELVQARLTPRGRALSAAIFDVLAFGFAAHAQGIDQAPKREPRVPVRVRPILNPIFESYPERRITAKTAECADGQRQLLQAPGRGVGQRQVRN